MISACGKLLEPPPTPPAPEDYIQAGWNAYEHKQYGEAVVQFDSALTVDAKAGEAYGGKAWCDLRFDQVEEAVQNGNLAVQNNYTKPDIYLLRATGALIQENYTDALSILSNVTGKVTTGWAFDHDPLVNYKGYVILTAQAHFYLGEFDQALILLQKIDDETRSIDPDDSSTWKYNGTLYKEKNHLLLAILDHQSTAVIGKKFPKLYN